MYCRNCGAELKEGQKFCTKCGAPITSATNTETKSAEPENADSKPTKDTTPKKMNTKVIAGIIAAVAVVAVIIIVVAIRSGGSEEQVTEMESEPEQVEETAQSEYEDEYAEDEESGLTAGEQEQLRQQEIIDNIDLDLTIKEGTFYDNIDQALQPDSDISDYDRPEYCTYYISGTITNNNDEDYCFYLRYNYDKTYVDNYGDRQTVEDPILTDNIVCVTAHETVPYYDKCSIWIGSDYENTSYVCTGVEVDPGQTGLESTIPKFSGYKEGRILPISEVSDSRIYAIMDEYNPETVDDVCVDFTITNNTDERWSKIYIDFYILLNGEYMGYSCCSGSYIKTGETAQVSEENTGDGNLVWTGGDGSIWRLPPEVINSDGSVIDGLEIQVFHVVYVSGDSE